jgi:exosome complex component MTR3
LLPAIQLHLFPKSTIDVFITVIENDGLESCVASASMAASTALADAGIEMLGMVVACCSVSFLYISSTLLIKVSLKAINDDGIWLDPDTAEAAASRGTLLLAGLPALGTITNLWQAGQMTSVDALQVGHFTWMIAFG